MFVFVYLFVLASWLNHFYNNDTCYYNMANIHNIYDTKTQVCDLFVKWSYSLTYIFIMFNICVKIFT